MTTTPAPSIATYDLLASGVGPFATSWVYADAADVTAALSLPAAPLVPLAQGVDYTLTATAPLLSGGSVTLSASRVPVDGWPTGARLILRRRTVRRQATALPDTEGHKPRATERALDRQMRIAQEDADDMARALLLPVGQTGGDLPWSPGDGERLLVIREDGSAGAAVGMRPEDLATPTTAGLVRASVRGGYAETVLGLKLGAEVDLNAEHGARGNNMDSDDAALLAALTDSYATDHPVGITGRGVLRMDQPLPDITRPVVFFGKGSPRDFVITPRGAADGFFNFRGTQATGRVASAGLRNMMFNGLGMTGGRLINVDFCQEALFTDVIWSDLWNFMRVRQTGEITFRGCKVDKLRGAQGFLAEGSNAIRNGVLDRIDVVDFGALTMTACYEPGVTAPNGDLVILDGRVHTTTWTTLRLLSSNSGLLTRDSFGLPQHYKPSFLHGVSLETENTWLPGLNLQAVNEARLFATFLASCVSGAGGVIGPDARDVNLFGGGVRSCWTDGLDINGARKVQIYGFNAWRNGGAGVDAYGGIRMRGGAQDITLFGGRYGKRADDDYVEQQGWGVINTDAQNVRAFGVDFRDNHFNAANGILGAVEVQGCLGAFGGGPSVITPSASPHVRTAGSRPELVNIYDGAGVVVSIDGVAVSNQTPCSFLLPAGRTASISYATAPKIIPTPIG